MKYEQKSFTVPASAGNAAYCAEHGHTLPDQRGRCLRCGARQTARQYIAQLDVPTNDGWRADPQAPGWDFRDVGDHSREHRPSTSAWPQPPDVASLAPSTDAGRRKWGHDGR